MRSLFLFPLRLFSRVQSDSVLCYLVTFGCSFFLCFVVLHCSVILCVCAIAYGTLALSPAFRFCVARLFRFRILCWALWICPILFACVLPLCLLGECSLFVVRFCAMVSAAILLSRVFLLHCMVDIFSSLRCFCSVANDALIPFCAFWSRWHPSYALSDSVRTL